MATKQGTKKLKFTSCFDQLWAEPIDDADVGSHSPHIYMYTMASVYTRHYS